MTTQLDCSIGIKEESVYGTPVTVDQFLEFTDESLDSTNEYLQGEGMRVGSRLARSDRRSLGKVSAGGSITVEAPTKGLGILLEAALGSVTNTETADTGVYQQVHTPATTDLLNSYTIQKGIPPIGGGATHPITFPGSMCDKLEIDCPNSGIVKVTADFLSREALTTESYASPSYPADLGLFTFVQGAIYLGNVVTKPTTTAPASPTGDPVATVRSAKVNWENGLDTEGFNMGGAGKRSRKHVTGKSALSGTLDAEYSDTVLRDAYLNQTELTFLLTLTHTATIGATSHPILQVYIPAIKLEGELPKAANGSPINQSVNFTGLDGLVSATSVLYVVYVTTDTAP